MAHDTMQACFTLYERWVETFVWLFVPFYSEIKSLFILFFLLTRAKVSTSNRSPPVVRPRLIGCFYACREQSPFSSTLFDPSSSRTQCPSTPYATP